MTLVARQPVADHALTKYARGDESTTTQIFRRVSTALFVEDPRREEFEGQLFAAMDSFRFLPAGRILSGAGTGLSVTLGNCFVMGDVKDDMGGIFDELKQSALTMQAGGGIGLNFSTLRPQGAPVKGVGADASGPLTFMDVWDMMCRTIMSAGGRRGAMMATMRCDHPDIEKFIDAKRTAGRLSMFNLSVLVTDAFMAALDADAEWNLTFNGKVYKTMPARELWGKIMRATYAYAEPGVIFIDRVNALNPLNYAEEINATNPCGEAPLPPYGTCFLGSVNLAALVRSPFTADAAMDEGLLADTMALAVRALDNGLDVSKFPLPEQKAEAMAKRRIGLGVTGLADALIMCGLRYGSPEGNAAVKSWMHALRRAAYLTSADLAEERGSFPLFDAEKHLASPSIQSLDDDVRAAIATKGLRNSHLGAVAPCGTISLLANNISSGQEPVFAFRYTRKVLQADGSKVDEPVSDYAFLAYCAAKGLDATDPATLAALPDYFVTADELTPEEHLAVLAICQSEIDQAVSKTINVAKDTPFEKFEDIYRRAYALGCKGCTTYRPNDTVGAVLVKDVPAAAVAEAPAPQPAAPAPAVAAPSAKRPGTLEGVTYKIANPQTDENLYITINHTTDEAGCRHIHEVFGNTYDATAEQTLTAAALAISLAYQLGDARHVTKLLDRYSKVRGEAAIWYDNRNFSSVLPLLVHVILGIHADMSARASDYAVPPMVANSHPHLAALLSMAEALRINPPPLPDPATWEPDDPAPSGGGPTGRTVPDSDAKGAAGPVVNGGEPVHAPSGDVGTTGTPAEQASAARVAADITRQLVAAGMAPEEAAINAALVASRYDARAARLNGAAGDAWQMYEAEGITIGTHDDATFADNALAQAANPFKRFGMARAEARFTAALNDLLAGEKSFGVYQLGETPPVLRALGFDNLDVALPRSVIEKAIAAKRGDGSASGKHNTQVTPEHVADLVRALADPLAVYEDIPDHGPGRVVVITDMVGQQGDPIAIVVAPHGTVRDTDVNVIPSVHARTEPIGRLLYEMGGEGSARLPNSWKTSPSGTGSLRSSPPENVADDGVGVNAEGEGGEDSARRPHSWTKSPSGTGSLRASPDDNVPDGPADVNAPSPVLTKADIIRQLGSVFWQPPTMDQIAEEALAAGLKPVDVNDPAFREWFGDSKTVDDNGVPVVMWHGCKAADMHIENGAVVFTPRFEVFDVGNDGGIEPGAWFSPDPAVAARYGTPVPFYVRITNPLRHEDPLTAPPTGYDGVYRMRGKGDDIRSAWEVAIFDPAQVKSAVYNSGEFSSTDARVFHQLNPDVDLDRLVDVVDLSSLPRGPKSPDGLLPGLKAMIGRPLSTADSDRIARFVRETVGHVASYPAPARYPRRDHPIRSAAVRNVADLLEHAVLIETGPNTKVAEKPDVGAYHRFYVPVWTGNELRTIRIVAEQTNKGIEIRPDVFDVYAVMVERGGRGSKRFDLATDATQDPSVRNTPPTSITIRDMLSGVNGMDHRPYVSVPIKTFEQAAWHGTPHAFARFDINRVNTGEGNQAFGWGLYFAGSRDVAEGYKARLSPLKDTIDGKEWGQLSGRRLDLIDGDGGVTSVTLTAAQAWVLEEARSIAPQPGNLRAGLNAVADDLVRAIDRGRDPDTDRERLREATALLARTVARGGRLYEVEIPDEGSYLLHDKPWSEQPDAVKTALLSAGVLPPARMAEIVRVAEPDEDGYRVLASNGYHSAWGRTESEAKSRLPEPTGGQIYERLVAETPGDNPARSVSRALFAVGIAGVKYLDGNSRSVAHSEEMLAKSLADVERFSADIARMDAVPEADRTPAEQYALDQRRLDLLDASSQADMYRRDIANAAYNYVVFDDSVIDIKEFHQAANQNVDPERRIDVLDLSGRVGDDTSPHDLLEILRSLAGHPLPTADVDRMGMVLPKHCRHIVWSKARSLGGDEGRAVRTSAIANLGDILAAAPLVESGPNVKRDAKPHADTYHRFYVPVWTGQRVVAVRIVAEQRSDGLLFDPAMFDIYDVVVETDRESGGMLPRSASDGENAPTLLLRDHSPTSSSVGSPDPSVNEVRRRPLPPATITIRELLSGVSDMQGRAYFQAATAPFRHPSMLAADVAAFAREVDRIIASGPDHRAMARVGETPLVINILGVTRKDLMINEDTVAQILHIDHDAVSADQLKRAVEMLASPVLVRRSRTQPNSLVAVLDENDADGNPLVAAIHIKDGDVTFHKFASLYGKEISPQDPRHKGLQAWLDGAFNDGDVLYLDRAKAATLATGIGVSIPSGPQARSLNPNVLFEDDLIKARAASPTLYQSPEAIPATTLGDYRGRIIITPGKTLLTLMEKADRSTFLHEMSHQWLDEMSRDAANPAAPEDLRRDWQIVLNWLGVEDARQIGYDQHEQWARGFEQFVMEGRSPSEPLDKVFDEFGNWMTGIYRTADSLRAPITDEIREVMARLVARYPQMATTTTTTLPAPSAPEAPADALQASAPALDPGSLTTAAASDGPPDFDAPPPADESDYYADADTIRREVERERAMADDADPDDTNLGEHPDHHEDAIMSATVTDQQAADDDVEVLARRAREAVEADEAAERKAAEAAMRADEETRKRNQMPGMIGEEFGVDASSEKLKQEYLRELGQWYKTHLAAKHEADIEWVRYNPGARPEVEIRYRDGSTLRDTGDTLLLDGKGNPQKAALMAEICLAKGMTSVVLRGTKEFKRDLAKACFEHGIAVENKEMQKYMAELRASMPEREGIYSQSENALPAAPPRPAPPPPAPEVVPDEPSSIERGAEPSAQVIPMPTIEVHSTPSAEEMSRMMAVAADSAEKMTVAISARVPEYRDSDRGGRIALLDAAVAMLPTADLADILPLADTAASTNFRLAALLPEGDGRRTAVDHAIAAAQGVGATIRSTLRSREKAHRDEQTPAEPTISIVPTEAPPDVASLRQVLVSAGEANGMRGEDIDNLVDRLDDIALPQDLTSDEAGAIKEDLAARFGAVEWSDDATFAALSEMTGLPETLRNEAQQYLLAKSEAVAVSLAPIAAVVGDRREFHQPALAAANTSPAFPPPASGQAMRRQGPREVTSAVEFEMLLRRATDISAPPMDSALAARDAAVAAEDLARTDPAAYAEALSVFTPPGLEHQPNGSAGNDGPLPPAYLAARLRRYEMRSLSRLSVAELDGAVDVDDDYRADVRQIAVANAARQIDFMAAGDGSPLSVFRAAQICHGAFLGLADHYPSGHRLEDVVADYRDEQMTNAGMKMLEVAAKVVSIDGPDRDGARKTIIDAAKTMLVPPEGCDTVSSRLHVVDGQCLVAARTIIEDKTVDPVLRAFAAYRAADAVESLSENPQYEELLSTHPSIAAFQEAEIGALVNVDLVYGLSHAPTQEYADRIEPYIASIEAHRVLDWTIDAHVPGYYDADLNGRIEMLSANRHLLSAQAQEEVERAIDMSIGENESLAGSASTPEFMRRTATYRIALADHAAAILNTQQEAVAADVVDNVPTEQDAVAVAQPAEQSATMDALTDPTAVWFAGLANDLATATTPLDRALALQHLYQGIEVVGPIVDALESRHLAPIDASEHSEFVAVNGLAYARKQAADQSDRVFVSSGAARQAILATTDDDVLAWETAPPALGALGELASSLAGRSGDAIEKERGVLSKALQHIGAAASALVGARTETLRLRHAMAIDAGAPGAMQIRSVLRDGIRWNGFAMKKMDADPSDVIPQPPKSDIKTGIAVAKRVLLNAADPVDLNVRAEDIAAMPAGPDKDGMSAWLDMSAKARLAVTAITTPADGDASAAKLEAFTAAERAIQAAAYAMATGVSNGNAALQTAAERCHHDTTLLATKAAAAIMEDPAAFARASAEGAAVSVQTYASTPPASTAQTPPRATTRPQDGMERRPPSHDHSM